MIKVDKIEKIKSNILYLNSLGYGNNFYESIKKCPFCKVVEKNDIEGLSLASYDAYIVSISIFKWELKNVAKLLEEIFSFNKPVIIVYNSRFKKDYAGYTYLKNKFKINFDEKDCSITEVAYDQYLPDDRNGYAISMLSNFDNGKSYIKNTKNCYILRFNNVSIIHDVKLNYYGAENKFIEQFDTLLLNLLNIPKLNTIPDWVKEIKILDDNIIEKDISNINHEIKKLEMQKDEKQKLLEVNNEYKKVLYSTGDELVEAVNKILSEMLNIAINDIDVKKEDLSLILDNKKILIEVKGVNTSVKRNHVSQVQRHIEDDAIDNNVDDNDIDKIYKGVLIINPYDKEPVKDKIKKDFYSVSVKRDIEYHNICTFDTITLLSLFQKFKNNNSSVDFKNIILNHSYNEPDFSIIEN